VAEFVREYAGLRWSVVVAFLFASAVVLGRLAAPAVGGAVRRTAGECGAIGRPVADVAQHVVDSARPHANSVRAACHESDAAHLIMCLVMLAMLVFPAGADPVALRGVLIAMLVVFAALLMDRILEWRNAHRALPVDQMVALGYHIVVATTMLYAMSGHSAGGHSGGPTHGPALLLAAVFATDAFALIIAASTGPGQRWFGHPIGVRTPADSMAAGSLVGRALSSALVPHLVMDLGTAYMLIAAVSG